MSTKYHLKHREKLLSDIVAGLRTVEKTRITNIRVRFAIQDMLVKEYLGLQPALEAIANDLFWDEESNWAEADNALVDTY